MVKTALLVTALAFLSTTAYADIITVTVTGIVAPYTWDGRAYVSTPLIDNGTFGSNQSLFGASFTESWSINTNCVSCDYTSNASMSASLTINNTTVDLGSGIGVIANFHNSSIDPSIKTNNGRFDAFYVSLTSVLNVSASNIGVNSFGSSFPGNVNAPWSYTLNPLTDNLDTPNQIGGTFTYGGLYGYLDPTTFTVENSNFVPVVQSFSPPIPVSVPFPTLGAGLPGLILLLFSWLASRSGLGS